MHVLVVFGNHDGGLLFMSFYTIMYMSVCVTYITRITQVTLKTINNWWLCFHHIKFLLDFSAHKHRLDGGVFPHNIC